MSAGGIATGCPANAATRSETTVVISTFNRCTFLPEAIRSILNQTRPVARIIVIDDGSTDETPKVLESFGSLIEWRRTTNHGKASALNLALQDISTEFVWFFDDDDAALPEAHDLLFTTISDCKELRFAFGDYWRLASSQDLLTCRRSPEGLNRYQYAQQSSVTQRLELMRQCTVMMTGSLLRTAAVRRVGCLNPKLIRGQDYDLLLRLAIDGQFAYCGKPVYLWREHSGVRGDSNSKHRSTDRVGVWASFNQEIGQSLASVLSAELIERELATEATTEVTLRRRSLITRAWIFATKGRISDCVKDLMNALELNPDVALDSEELRLLQECFHHDFVAYQSPFPLFKLLRMKRTRNRGASLAAIGRGLYWMLRSEPRLIDRLRWALPVAAVGCAAVL
jgi:GT2 family glycosyltransferase